MQISRNDLNCDVVKAVIAHYRDADSKVRIASIQGALFVLRWQAAEKLSDEALARVALKNAPKLDEEIARSSVELRGESVPQSVWTLLDRLVNTAVRPQGMSVTDHRRLLDENVTAAKALLENYNRAQ